MIDREAGTEIMMRLSAQTIELGGNYIEAGKKFNIKYHNSKLFKIQKNISARAKSTGTVLI
jgi:hypothetical protein